MQEANTLIGARFDALHPYYAACLYNPLKWIVQLLTFTLAKVQAPALDLVNHLVQQMIWYMCTT